MAKQIVSNALITKILEHWINITKANPAGKHYDITTSSWWIKAWTKRNTRVAEIVTKLEKSNEYENDRELLKELFSIRNNVLFNQINGVRKLVTIINKGQRKKITALKKIVLAIKQSEEYDDDWSNIVYDLLNIKYEQARTNLGKILSEIRLGLYPTSEAMFNQCSRDVLLNFYEFNKWSYLDFKAAFLMFQNYYQKFIGKLSNSAIENTNQEIDIFFNYFHKDRIGMSFLKKQIKLGKVLQNNGENLLIHILDAINTKPFIILSGISGTGKTQIARIISVGLIDGGKGLI